MKENFARYLYEIYTKTINTINNCNGCTQKIKLYNENCPFCPATNIFIEIYNEIVCGQKKEF